VRSVSLGRGRVLEDDRHERLANHALPRPGHLPPHAAVGRHAAGGGRRGREAVGVAGRGGGHGVGVLPDKVAYGARDQLEAVGVGARGDQREVPRGTHLQDLREGDLLRGGAERTTLKPVIVPVDMPTCLYALLVFLCLFFHISHS